MDGDEWQPFFSESKRIYLWFQHAPVLPLVGGEEEGVEDGAGVAEEDDQPGVRREAVQELAVAVEVAHAQSGPRNYTYERCNERLKMKRVVGRIPLLNLPTAPALLSSSHNYFRDMTQKLITASLDHNRVDSRNSESPYILRTLWS